MSNNRQFLTAEETPNYEGLGGKSNGYINSISVDDDDLLEEQQYHSNRANGNARQILDQFQQENGDNQEDPMDQRKRIIDRESEYQKRRYNTLISPARDDPYLTGDQTPANNVRTYGDVMREHELRTQKEQTLRNINAKKLKEQQESQQNAGELARSAMLDMERPTKASGLLQDKNQQTQQDAGIKRKKNRWDQAGEEFNDQTQQLQKKSKFDMDDTPSMNRFDATPLGPNDETPAMGIGEQTPAMFDATPNQFDATPGIGATPGGETPKMDGQLSRWDATPGATPGMTPGYTPGITPAQQRKNRWDETPLEDKQIGDTPAGFGVGVTPGGKKMRSRWDETPATPDANFQGATPAGGVGATPGATPSGKTPMATPSAGQAVGETPMMGAQTPQTPMTPDQYMEWKAQKDIDVRNREWSDEELDTVLPGETEGYKVIDPPVTYQPIRTPARKLQGPPTMTPIGGTPGYQIPSGENQGGYGLTPLPEGLPELKPEDIKYFEKLTQNDDEEGLSLEEQKERKIMKLLLKVKNGTPPQRKSALRQLTERARQFGAEALFNQILPLLMSPHLEDQERHLLVKVIDRILYKLDELVRPYVHKILVVIEPLLIDEDYYARVEGREIIANLSKAAGLPSMLAAMRPDIDELDEYVRNVTARALSVVASAMGIPALLPFLGAVCASKKNWQGRHTGIKIVQQIAILMGCAVLPHLKQLVDIIKLGLTDDNQKVKTITALSVAALAEAAAPYGMEAFYDTLEPLFYGINMLRGKVLAAYLKAIGFIIPLMENPEHQLYYTSQVMRILTREFQTPDEEMKKIVLKVVKQCMSSEGVTATYIRDNILPEFFRCFWQRRMANDRRNYRQLVDTTVEIASKVGCSEIVGRVVLDLNDESEPYRKMVVETVDKVIQNLGVADINADLEEQLVDGILYAYQEQVNDESFVIMNGFGTIISALNTRAKGYLPQICGIIKFRLNNKNPRVRQQAADVIAKIAPVLRDCNEEAMLGHLGVVLYEYLGEEYPDVLGSILGALKSVVNNLGMNKMQPPIKDLLPRLTPILKNRHEKVQENAIDLVGRIADRGHEHVPAREWMRICFELLDMLKAHKKAIRRATVNTFGYIAKAIGPQDVLITLLNNLKVQERQNRVCTTVAIGVVAETCQPFTVIPALMNEYRVPELNVQNGVLKALSFMFEYIGETGRDYIYSVTPLLEDALMDRDLVHRQTASAVCMHIALGVVGLGCEDALIHLLNYVWPNIFETSPHVIQAVMGAIDGFKCALGPVVILNYILQGLFHPARKVRQVYWKVYNNLYISHEDPLVAFYPRIKDDDRNTYERHELDLFI